jgi:hypothetical protein
MINGFSKEVQDKLGYYVYRLIDPRNGQTFYVGKGKGNRIFEHFRDVKGYYGDSKDIDEDDKEKYKTIQRIRQDGLEVIYIIQRWNLTEKEAFEVEAALIDAYQGLSNIQRGHHVDFCANNAEVIQKIFSKKVYEEPKNFKYMIIKIRQQRIDEMFSYEDSTYEAVRYCWKIKPKSIEEYPYVFAVKDGIVLDVYKIDKWQKVENSDRYEFFGKPAEKEIRDLYKDTRIPDTYCVKGMASPVLYSKNKV